MRLEEKWSIEEGRIRRFFMEQPDVIPDETGFSFGGCRIRLIPVTESLLGKWPQQRTVVIMEGPEADTARIHRRFFLQFLSAGG